MSRLSFLTQNSLYQKQHRIPPSLRPARRHPRKRMSGKDSQSTPDPALVSDTGKAKVPGGSTPGQPGRAGWEMPGSPCWLSPQLAGTHAPPRFVHEFQEGAETASYKASEFSTTSRATLTASPGLALAPGAGLWEVASQGCLTPVYSPRLGPSSDCWCLADKSFLWSKTLLHRRLACSFASGCVCCPLRKPVGRLSWN